MCDPPIEIQIWLNLFKNLHEKISGQKLLIVNKLCNLHAAEINSAKIRKAAWNFDFPAYCGIKNPNISGLYQQIFTSK